MISNAIAAFTALALAAGAQAVPQGPPASGAQQPGLATATVVPPSQQDQKDPFNQLDWTPPLLKSAEIVTTTAVPAPGLTAMPQWKVECGIKVMVVSPDIDPKSLITAPQGGPEAKIRRISPPPCPERDSK
jgi:hypothetical protein